MKDLSKKSRKVIRLTTFARRKTASTRTILKPSQEEQTGAEAKKIDAKTVIPFSEATSDTKVAQDAASDVTQKEQGNTVLTTKKILRELETLNWQGHVELPVIDMQWLASQLYVRLNATNSEVCEACGHVRPLVITTRLGPICAECVEDMNDNVDQIREVLDTE